MKETIYTIPINEAYEQDTECPLCYIYSRLEKEALDYGLGAAMMEPDYRIESNEKGYCNRHLSMLFSSQNKLSLSLCLDTHLEEMRKALDKLSDEAQKLTKESGLFKKNCAEYSKKLSDFLDKKEGSCIICDKISRTMKRYTEILIEMWDTEPDFKEKFENSKGVCLPHLSQLAKTAPRKLSQKKCSEFLSSLMAIEKKELLRIQDDIHRFTLKFDYRNQDMEWGTAKDAPARTIEKLSGTIIKEERN